MGEINTNLIYSMVAASLTLFLGMEVWNHNRNSATGKIFIVHSLVGAVWTFTNYWSITATASLALQSIRMVMFFAVPHLFLFLIFIKNFPSSKLAITKKEMVFWISWQFILMSLTQTPLIFNNVATINGSTVPQPGRLIAFFGLSLIFIFVYTIVLIVKKYSEAEPAVAKKQWFYIGSGLIFSYSLLIFFVFLRVIILNDTRFVAYSPLFLLPIFVGASYAILKHQLFNVKIITTEFIAFILLLASLVQVAIAANRFSLLISIGVTVFVLFSSILLLNSVILEVRQREQLEKLTGQLTDANEKLKALDQARAEFISIASHQLRTPPATVKWYLSAIIAGDYGPLDPKVKETLERAERTNNLLISLIEDILNVSRIERGKMEFLFEATDLDPMAAVTFEQLEPLAIQKKQKLTYEPPASPLPPLMVDKEKLRQVMNNLIDNAIKYTQQGGKIKVSLRKAGGNIIFKVTDNGQGIEPADIAPLFEKYTRGRESYKHNAGLGLGLYVAKVIIEQHNGTIWAESKGPNKGSSFIFSLPVKTNLKPSTVVDLTPQKK